MSACIGEPISWPRLERHAIAPDATVAAHLDACRACRTCMDAIAADTIALPELPRSIASAPKRRTWVRVAAPAFALAAAAIVVLVVFARREAPEDRFAIKGGGELVLGLVRERAGAIADDPTTFRTGDRWKVVVTCPPGNALDLVTSVAEIGPGASVQIDHPLAPAHVACGNRVALPGAFSLTGAHPNRICVALGAQTACRTISADQR